MTMTRLFNRRDPYHVKPYTDPKSVAKSQNGESVAIVPYSQYREARRLDRLTCLWFMHRCPNMRVHHEDYLYQDAHRKRGGKYAPEYLTKSEAAWVRRLARNVSACNYMPVVPIAPRERAEKPVQLQLIESPHLWKPVTIRYPGAVDLFSRHYSAKKNGKTRKDWLKSGFAGIGETMVLMTHDERALFAWRLQQYRADGYAGWLECNVFRNESQQRSSDLILDAMKLARQRWGNLPMFTFVNAGEISSSNPGYCFKCAGWKFAGKSKSELHILEYHQPVTLLPVPGNDLPTPPDYYPKKIA